MDGLHKFFHLVEEKSAKPVWAAVTKYHKRGEVGLVNNKTVFSVLEAGSLRSRCQDHCLLVRTLFRVADCPLLIVSSQGREQREKISSHDSHKGKNLIMRAPSR